MMTKSMNTKEEKKVLIVPPGLKERYETFKDHYEVAAGAPILILGPTGVGKTLFYQTYKHLFLDEHKDVSEDKIVMANCAHFGNQNSDPNIARSELFGTEKSAKLNIEVKDGLIQKADGGVLFLEEIGELPIAVQAMLLTFIEDKTFKRVGGSQTETSNCRIVAATNNESALREDFKNRFFPFHLPPVYERRNDVLYYLHEKNPDLIASLYKDEILVLLSYNWPGNVREIERVELLMRRTLMKRERLLKQKPLILLDRDWWKLFKTAEIDFGGSSRHKNINLYNELKKIGADADYLESLLKKYGLSFVGSYKDPDCCPFKDTKTTSLTYKTEDYDDYVIKIYDKYKPFENAYEGYILFCILFLQNYLDNKNVMKDLTECNPTIAAAPESHFNKSDSSKFNNLQKKIFFFLTGIELDKRDRFPSDYSDLISFLEKQAKIHNDNDFLSNMRTDNKTSKDSLENLIEKIGLCTQKELLSAYYKEILEYTNWNVSAASRQIEVPPQSFRDKLDKWGIMKE